MSGGPDDVGGDGLRTLRARWVFPGSGPPIRDGRVVIAGDRIVAVDANPAESGGLDLGDAAIVPGFVNAHTHLELGPIPRDEADGPEDEVAWLGRVIRSRLDSTPEATADRIERNVRALVESGTTAVGDITTAGQSWAAVTAAPLRGTVFSEVLGLSTARALQTYQAALAAIAPRVGRTAGDPLVIPGMSPHAPYSTAGELYRLAAKLRLPLATHLGELPEEREFLEHRSGPLRRFVEGLGAWSDAWRPLGPSPVDYVAADPALRAASWVVAHGNILEPAEYARLVPDRSDPAARRLAVAYCPRTHARFGHPPHPFRAMRDAGVVVCLGTDSLASSPSLSILDELRFLRRHHPNVPGATLLSMATAHGAWALRIDDRAGTLAPGKSADLAVLPLGPAASGADPHDAWLDHDAPPLATMFRGRFVVGTWA